MTLTRHFRDHAKALIVARLQANANTNGVSRDRSLDQYRYEAGRCAGLSEACTLLDDAFKQLSQEEDD